MLLVVLLIFYAIPVPVSLKTVRRSGASNTTLASYKLKIQQELLAGTGSVAEPVHFCAAPDSAPAQALTIFPI
jgi:hypothetical protein